MYTPVHNARVNVFYSCGSYITPSIVLNALLTVFNM